MKVHILSFEDLPENSPIGFLRSEKIREKNFREIVFREIVFFFRWSTSLWNVDYASRPIHPFRSYSWDNRRQTNTIFQHTEFSDNQLSLGLLTFKSMNAKSVAWIFYKLNVKLWKALQKFDDALYYIRLPIEAYFRSRGLQDSRIELSKLNNLPIAQRKRSGEEMSRRKQMFSVYKLVYFLILI